MRLEHAGQDDLFDGTPTAVIEALRYSITLRTLSRKRPGHVTATDVL
ncbi:hypothetical protein NU688_07765 [Variovorax sp. ZS18.2.2]|nr:hypothetical protein [Variovorax sp. ZS18.2.2]MCR6476048.1 hypothetical protein [Variovorax sp. ZS18.2.2]